MPSLLHHLVEKNLSNNADLIAIRYKNTELSYQELNQSMVVFTNYLLSLNMPPQSRVAIYLPKIPEAVISFFSSSMAGLVFVPINPQLKAVQVKHILNDSQASILITSPDRAKLLSDTITQSKYLQQMIVTGSDTDTLNDSHIPVTAWENIDITAQAKAGNINPDDMVAILYTSGSTGAAKGVVLSHTNLIAGANSVSQYLKNTQDDRLLALLPFSFDYGLSQLTTAFFVGASVTLMDYLLPRDVIKRIVKDQITGLAAVPPLWHTLAPLDWSQAALSLRYITSSGGSVPVSLTEHFQQQLPNTDIVWMYGLTEAFRSTYLPPEHLKSHPESMGIPIPYANLYVVRPDGTECDADEVGELVHSGILVSKGYWNNPIKTNARFRPAPNTSQSSEQGIAVWSGDLVKKDKDGFFYFVGRNDEMIKTSGYRVSPGEIEQNIYQLPAISEVVALGVKHPTLGQAIIIIASGAELKDSDIIQYCRQQLPNFMQPQKVILMPSLPKNANGKIDRSRLHQENQHLFMENS